MDFVCFWIASIVLSKLIKSTTNNKVYKDLIESGYKIDKNKINNNEILINDGIPNKIDFIPFLNLFINLELLLTYQDYFDDMKASLKSKSKLIELTKEERKEYNDWPSISNAIYISYKDELIKRTIKSDNGIIVYSIDDDYNISIINSTGIYNEIDEIQKLNLIKLYEIKLNKKKSKVKMKGSKK